MVTFEVGDSEIPHIVCIAIAASHATGPDRIVAGQQLGNPTDDTNRDVQYTFFGHPLLQGYGT